MADSRTPREVLSREKNARMTAYMPPSNLPDPTPDPNYAFRWIATHVLGQADPTNVSKKLREGWVPVKAADHPEMMYMGSESGNIEIGGLMLCKMPRELAKSRDEYYAAQANAQMESVDAKLDDYKRQGDSRMPLFAERKSGTSRGFGNGS